MPSAMINGIELYYETHGAGFPLVFVHGGFGGLGTGQGNAPPPWVERFAQSFEVILYDRRSSGRSEYPTSAHTMAQFADDIQELLRHLGHPRAHVWGTSAGGPITLQFGLDHPGSAQSLVVSDTAPWLSKDAQLLAALRERIEILEREGETAAYEARRTGGTVGINLFAPPPARSGSDAPHASPKGEAAPRDSGADAIRAQLAAIPREERIAKYAGELRTYSAYLDWDASARLSELKMPLLVLYGTGDRVFPDVDWPALTADMVNVTYRAYAGEDHGLTNRLPGSMDEIHRFLEANS